MSYPPFCMFCNNPADTSENTVTLDNTKPELLDNKKTIYNLCWNSDFNCEDYGYDHEGIVGVYSCSHCDRTFNIIDIFLENSQPRIIKYNHYCDDEIKNGPGIQAEPMINSCLYCATKLEPVSSEPSEECDPLIQDSPEEPVVKTTLYCPTCNLHYNVVDYTSETELYPCYDEDIYTLRNIYIEE